ATADALAPVRVGDPDLVDEQLQRLVRVHVADAGGHADDRATGHGHNDVVHGVGQELAQQLGADLVVEDPGRHPVQEVSVLHRHYVEGHVGRFHRAHDT